MKDVLLLAVIALTGAGMLRWLGVIDRLMGIRSVDARGAEELVRDGALVLDVRTDEEFAQVRIPSARHIPLTQVSQRLDELEGYRRRPIVVNCRSGSRSARACALLRKKGFDAYNLKGGIGAWHRAGMELEE